MKSAILFFILLFCVPMGLVMSSLLAATWAQVAEQVGLGVLLLAAALLLPGALRRLFRHRERAPSPRAVAGLAWPRSLTRSELENYCVAWLRGRGWEVALASDPEKNADAIFVMAGHGTVKIAVLCDRRGEELNPATIRAFAHAASELGATRHAVLTLRRGKLPPPAEGAARQAGVALLRVADLPQLDALMPAAPATALAESAAA